MNLSQVFMSNLNAYRIELGVSWERLSKRCGYSCRTLPCKYTSVMVHGQGLNMFTIEKICEALGINPVAMMEEE